MAALITRRVGLLALVRGDGIPAAILSQFLIAFFSSSDSHMYTYYVLYSCTDVYIIISKNHLLLFSLLLLVVPE